MTRLRRIGRERGEVTGFETKDRTELSTVRRTKAKLKFLPNPDRTKLSSPSGEKEKTQTCLFETKTGPNCHCLAKKRKLKRYCLRPRQDRIVTV
jgi:hypothetical protein